MNTTRSQPRLKPRRSPSHTSEHGGGASGGFDAPAAQMAEKTPQPVLGAFYESGPALRLNGNGSGHGANGHGAAGGPADNGRNGASGVQFKLAISRPGDPFEREADAAADRVTSGGRMPAITPLGPGALSRMATLQREPAGEEEEQPSEDEIVQPCACEEEQQGSVEPPRVQRQAAEEEEEDLAGQGEAVQALAIQRQAGEQEEQEPEVVQPCKDCGDKRTEVVQRQDEEEEQPDDQKESVQRQSEEEEEPADVQTAPADSSAGTASPDSTVGSVLSHPEGGAPLAPSIRSRLEPSLGADLSGVRIHSDSAAQQTAHALKARAFTHGQDIWLSAGESPTDTRLMAHEATHVVQQNGSDGRVQMAQRATAGRLRREGDESGRSVSSKEAPPASTVQAEPVEADVQGEAQQAAADAGGAARRAPNGPVVIERDRPPESRPVAPDATSAPGPSQPGTGEPASAPAPDLSSQREQIASQATPPETAQALASPDGQSSSESTREVLEADPEAASAQAEAGGEAAAIGTQPETEGRAVPGAQGPNGRVTDFTAGARRVPQANPDALRQAIPQRDLTEEELSAELSLDRTPAQTQAAIQRMLVRLEADAVQEKNDILSEAENLKVEILAFSELQVANVQTTVQVEIAAIRAGFRQGRSGLEAAASAQRAVVDQQISQEVIQIQANTSAKIVETNTQLTERQTALTAYGEEQSRQPHTIADEEAARAQGEIEAAAGEAERVGDTVASRYSEPDSKVAAREVAAESAADMREKPPSIADGLRAKADEFANQYMEFANGVNTQIEGARPQLESALNDASLTAVAGIQATRSSTIQAIDDRLRIDLQALNQGEALAVQQTQAAGEIAITQTQSEAQRFVGEVDTASEMLISNVDATIAEASVVVSAEPSPYLPGIEDVIEAARAAVQTSSAQGRDALRNRVDSNLPALEEIVAEFASEASELTRTAQDSAAEVLDRGVGAIQAVVDRRNQTAQQQVMSLTTQQQEMVDQALGQIDQAIEQARSRMRSVNDAIRTRVHEAAEESITEAKKPLTDPLESRADSAADRADDNVILGILQAIGDIVVGFIIILAIAVVVAAVFGLTLGGALLIVGGIALVVGVVMAYQARSEQLQREGIQAAGGFIFLLALSDATGITGVGEAIHGVDVVTGQRLRGRERARRGTLGLVTAVALVFGVRGALKGPSGGWTRPTSIFRGPGNITWGALVKNVKGVGKDLAAAWQATKRGIESIRERFRGRTQRSGEGPPPEETAPQEQPRTEEPVQETRTTPSPEETTGRRSGPEETPTAARVRRLNELARDPDHGNAVSDSSRAEAEVALGLEERGELPGPVRRPVRGDGHSGDFVDGQGGDWDVKAPRSRQNLIDEIRSRARAANRPEPRIDPARPIRGEFDIARTMTEIRGELAAGEGVIIDTRGLNPTDLANLRAAIQQEGLGSRVKFYP